MNNKTRSILKGIAVVLVILVILMQTNIIIIPALSYYKVWIVVVAFGLLLVSSK